MEHFEKFGQIFKIIIPIDTTKSRGEFRGYALVTFHDSENAQAAINCTNHVILSRKVIKFYLKV